jgi:hypothetical protein
VYKDAFRMTVAAPDSSISFLEIGYCSPSPDCDEPSTKAVFGILPFIPRPRSANWAGSRRLPSASRCCSDGAVSGINAIAAHVGGTTEGHDQLSTLAISRHATADLGESPQLIGGTANASKRLEHCSGILDCDKAFQPFDIVEGGVQPTQGQYRRSSGATRRRQGVVGADAVEPRGDLVVIDRLAGAEVVLVAGVILHPLLLEGRLAFDDAYPRRRRRVMSKASIAQKP